VLKPVDPRRKQVALTKPSLADVHTKSRQEAEDALKSQLSQKDLQMAAMNRTIEELKRPVMIQQQAWPCDLDDASGD
jgi:hypothetical protein